MPQNYSYVGDCLTAGRNKREAIITISNKINTFKKQAPVTCLSKPMINIAYQDIETMYIRYKKINQNQEPLIGWWQKKSSNINHKINFKNKKIYIAIYNKAGTRVRIGPNTSQRILEILYEICKKAKSLPSLQQYIAGILISKSNFNINRIELTNYYL